ncbi:hypothetical protein chiPu_0033251, partial [Chiloscyllium punctatum]|nr:hypothetical protein [Chiloscyllium punctatum]
CRSLFREVRPMRRSGPAGEERGEPGLDIVGDLVRGAVLCVAQGAGASEALVGARHVIGYARERGTGHDRLVRGDLDQVELGVDAIVLAARQRGGRVDHQRGAAGGEAQHQPVRRRHASGGAVELEGEGIADLDADPGLAGGIRLVDRRNLDAHQLFAQRGR